MSLNFCFINGTIWQGSRNISSNRSSRSSISTHLSHALGPEFGVVHRQFVDTLFRSVPIQKERAPLHLEFQIRRRGHALHRYLEVALADEAPGSYGVTDDVDDDFTLWGGGLLQQRGHDRVQTVSKAWRQNRRSGGYCKVQAPGVSAA
jgi:hypothetical protein